MIVVKLMGGLGNQLFQYATAKALAIKLNKQVYVDLSFLEADPKGQYTQRTFELPFLKVDYEMATEGMRSYFVSRGKSKWKRQLYRTYPQLFKAVYYAETGRLFQPSFQKIKGSVYLDGFWQSEKYFSSIRGELLKMVKPVLPFNATNQIFLKEILETVSVSLHVRRGDYVTHKEANAYHGLVGLDYYKEAIRRIAEVQKIEKVFVFSDDPNWCKENIQLPYPITFISNNTGINSYIDLELMRNCKHQIIANSSFSWWGAWLNDYNEKIVIAPKKWFADAQSNDSDLIPSKWIRL